MLWGLGCLSAGRNSSNCSASEPLDSSFTTESTHLTATQLAALEAEQANEQCWICLESGSTTHRLVRPCACPRFVHECCMARWQLQSAGKEEERRCRFCQDILPDWKRSLTPPDVKPSRTAVMAVVLNGREHRITVEPGPQGRRQFEREIRRLFSLAEDDELEFTFDCQAPGMPHKPEVPSENLQLEGKGAFEAAFHCAAVTAALRAQRKHPAVL